MMDPSRDKFVCSGPYDALAQINDFADSFPDELRRRLLDIASEYLVRGRSAELYKRINNRTASEIVSDWEEFEKQTASKTKDVVAEGEIDGMRYRLYEAPDEKDKNCDLDPDS